MCFSLPPHTKEADTKAGQQKKARTLDQTFMGLNPCLYQLLLDSYFILLSHSFLTYKTARDGLNDTVDVK